MHPLDASPRLDRRTSPTARAGILFVPVGATEQHGPHLPVSVDAVVAEAVATALAERVRAGGGDALIAPTVPYGASGEHQEFPGTISIGTEALSFLLREIGRSASAWADRIVFVNGHGGNLDALGDAVPTLRSEERDVVWIPCAARSGGDAHAGRGETSLTEHLLPGQVRWDRATAGDTRPLSEILPLLRAGGVRAVSASGVLGDPAGASAAEGARLMGQIVDDAWDRMTAGIVAANGCLAPRAAR